MSSKIKYAGVIFVVLLLSVALFQTRIEPFQSFSLRFNDLNFALQTKEASKEVVFIEIDEESVNRFGRWPWSRSVLAKGISNVGSSSLLILDMVFSEPTPSDGILSQTLADQDNNLCGFFLRQNASSGISSQQMEILNDSTLHRLSSQLGNRRVFVEAHEAEVNVESILSSCSMSATFSALRDSDQLFRKYPLAFSFSGELYPSIGAQALRMRYDQDIFQTEERLFDLAGHSVSTDEKGFARLNYYPLSSYQSYSFLALYDGKLEKSVLKDKIVILGITEIGVGDVRATPIGMIPGPLVHYTFISNVLNDELLHENTLLAYLSLLFFLLLPLIWVAVSSIYRRVMIYASAYLLFFITSKLSYLYLNLYLDAFYPLLGLLFSAIVSEVMLRKEQDEQTRFIEEAFSSYLSPVLLKKLIQEPSRLALGGEKKELTIFFSDIRSFTSISETMDPQKLTKFLNRYFTPMSDIVLEHRGMIDKYIGDAVMAFYNAPLDVEEHAREACRSALKMIDVLDELNGSFSEEGLPKIEIGIGINTAEVVVGNMGSNQRFNYTVIGDGVNLASRVEGLNKNYGTNILITEFTKKHIGEEFLTREVEFVKVKGKEEEVLLYELLKDTPDNRALVQKYDVVLGMYKQGNLKEALKGFEALKEDSVSRYFVQRINDA